MSKTTTRPRMVTTSPDLDSLCDEISGEPYYALDTEFHTERTYYPKLALIQVGWADKVALVDPLAVDPAPLATVFAGPGVAVAHAAEQDVDVLETACGGVPATVFDTQIVAGFLGLSTPSLGRLIDQMLGVTLPKADQLSDWLTRPIPDRQITYAAGDVAYLLELRSVLTEQLEERGRLTWALEECAQVLAIQAKGRGARGALVEDGRRPEAERAFPGSGAGGGGLEGPPRRVSRPAPTTRPLRSGPPGHRAAAAPQPPGAPAARAASTGATWRNGAATEILDAIARGLALTPAEIRLPPDGRDAQAPPAAVAVCAGLVRQIADDLHFDQGLLATRSDISNLLSGEPSRLEVGWRSTIAGDPIRRLMAGEAAAAFNPDGTLVLEERSHRPLP